ncbi:MAG: FAD-dependent monooxygenase [Alphaproteobacteria bacterium]|nr:FAD-dependent monooxygenase [Alphaproteobacteria bacterium]
MSAHRETIDCDILIVGAGIAGSAAACALRRRGYSVVAVEASNRPLDTARGDHLQAVVVDILDRWGALPAFWAAGAEKRHAARYLTDGGDPIITIDYRTLPVPHPYYLYLHHELIAETFLKLAAENPAFRLMRPARAKDFDVTDAGIASLTLHLADGEASRQVVIKPRMVIGADGRTSRVREALGFAFDTHEYENPLVVHFAPRLSADEDPLNHFTSFMGPNGSISRIPRAFGAWKLGLVITKDDIAFWKAATLAERRAKVGRIAPQLEPLALELGGFYAITLLNTRNWVKGNTVLLGDACHAMHPARGQGMNVAIRCLDFLTRALPEPADMGRPEVVRAALAAYERNVKPITEKVLAENHALGTARERLGADYVAQTMASLGAIQADPECLRRYTMDSAGYGDWFEAAANSMRS